MSIVTQIQNGKVVENKKTDDSQVKQTNNFDKDMFLKLLVAEMQYQDPLEPTSNSEYVSELASFSQIEAIQNVEGQMKNMESASLVGKYVILLTKNDAGESEHVSGKVDYVMNDGGDMYLAVNDKLYSIEDLDSVVDESYFTAVTIAQTFVDAVGALPNINNLTLQDEEKVIAARQMFDALDSYQKQFVDEDAVKVLEAVEKRIQELKENADKTEVDSSNADESEQETQEVT